ncbi:MFS transporter [Mycobacterium sp.]|uniref:MFS transporter n=1 Tax=Mycobacterium sp. TaxID=1785 RepID=UPI002BC3A99F|nr:MFS transporter [Mycobacterium sp.]HTH86289.1 MFS transporter [Mycobacterium sp.]
MTAELLIGACALLGVAGATLAPSTLALIRGLFLQPRDRSIAVGVWASMFSAGAPLGPVVGGLLLEHFWWGSVFLINVPVMVVLLVGGIVLLPEQRNPTPGPWDLPSVGLSLVGVLGLVYAVKEGAANGLRVDIAVIGVGGVAAFILFRPAPAQAARSTDRRAAIPQSCVLRRGRGQSAFSTWPFGPGVLSVPILPAGTGLQPDEGRAGRTARPVAATVFGVLAGFAVRYWSQRAVLTTGLALVGVAMASLTAISPSTAYLRVGIAPMPRAAPVTKATLSSSRPMTTLRFAQSRRRATQLARSARDGDPARCHGFSLAL